MRGPGLKYWRAVKASVIPRDVRHAAPDGQYRQGGAADTTQAEPYIIVGDRLRFKGDDRMWAGGKVTIDRSDFAARGDSMMLDQTTGFGVLVGTPSVEGRSGGLGISRASYTLVGTRIELGLAQRDIRKVKALGHGKATGADWVLTADTIDLRVADRKLQQTCRPGRQPAAARDFGALHDSGRFARHRLAR